jgi:hypothetical protein
MSDHRAGRRERRPVSEVTNLRAVRRIEHRFAGTTVTNRATLVGTAVRLPTGID